MLASVARLFLRFSYNVELIPFTTFRDKSQGKLYRATLALRQKIPLSDITFRLCHVGCMLNVAGPALDIFSIMILITLMCP